MPAWKHSPAASRSPLRPALFLDRDGVVIRDCHYLSDPDQVELLPGVADLFAAARAAGYLIIGLSNQSGIGRGLIAPEQFAAVTDRLVDLLAAVGARFDDFLYCPHAPDAGCACRKPRPGLLEEAAGRQPVDLARSWMVGDKTSDIALGRDAGLGAVLVRTGYGAASEGEVTDRWGDDDRVWIVDDLRGVWAVVTGADGED